MGKPKSTTESPKERAARIALEAVCADLGRRIKAQLPEGIGMTLLLFDFGEGGNMAYLSSANRGDMCRAMREFLGKLEE